MRILYAASEANPFAKSGGLADVAGALPKALVKDGVDARVIMPLYGDLKFRDKVMFYINSKPAFRQIAHMAHRCCNFVICPEILFHRLDFCR